VFWSTEENHPAEVPVPIQRRLIDRLRALRAKHRLTQEGFAELAGLGYKHYQLVEIGKKPDLRLSTLERIASAYGIGVHQLLAPRMPPSKIRSTRSR